MDLEQIHLPEEGRNTLPEKTQITPQEACPPAETQNISSGESLSLPEESQDFPQEPQPPADIAVRRAAQRARNDKLIRRIRWIAAAGFAAFFVMVWLLLRAMNPVIIVGHDPLQVVSAEISALGRGDLNTAYSQLSRRYRDAVPFNTYHMLVISHRRVFLTRKYTFSQQEKRGSQMYVVAELESENGTRYTARFTLVRDSGRWWIDDLHWHAADRTSVRT